MTTSFQITQQKAQTKSARKLTWPDFQRRYLNREDSYKYEWVNGDVVKTQHIDKTQFFILRNIQAAFRLLLFSGKAVGELISEGDIFFGGNHRRPDICYLTDEQIDRMAANSNDVPSFVIEVISTNDQMNTVRQKMADYKKAGVQCVWQVLPLVQELHVYTGQNLQEMRVFEGDETCSAAPALPLFEMSVNQVFHRSNPS